jgi:Arc/MetJ-type ribon-helix-helix transcriptional regulator
MADAQEIAITLLAPDLETINELIADGGVDSVTDFVQRAVRLVLDDVEAGGEFSAEEFETVEMTDALARALDEVETLFRRR